MKKAMIRQKAEQLIATGEFINESGGGIWKNCFYRQNGCLFNIQYKNGRLYDVISYGR